MKTETEGKRGNEKKGKKGKEKEEKEKREDNFFCLNMAWGKNNIRENHFLLN